MKYEGTRPSSKDRDIMIHQFALGRREMELLENVCQQCYEKMPKDIETMTARRRLANIIKGLRKARLA